MKKKLRKPELLAPAGNLEKLKVACIYGADAVFIGGQEFGLRSNAQNFTIEEIEQGVRFANEFQVKVYVTTNIFAHDLELEPLENYMKSLEKVGVTGIIVADPLLIDTAQRVAPKLEIHISTQTSITNIEAARFYEQLGAHRVVLARELSKNEIKEIIDGISSEVEVFVHGGMCIAYSGRCTLSNHMTARDSNRGGCSHSCRWDYDLEIQDDTKRQDVFSKDKDVTPFAMSAKDLNLLEYIPDMIDMGVHSLKVEGRMKSIHYIATVISNYRKIIDAYLESPETFRMDEQIQNEIAKSANRPFAPAFFADVPSYEEQLYGIHQQPTTHEYTGVVLAYNKETQMATIEQRNHFRVGDVLELFGPDKEGVEFICEQLYDEANTPIEVAPHPLMIVQMKLPKTTQPYDILRKRMIKT